MEKIKISAFHLAEGIDIKKIKTDYTSKLISETSNELFYEMESKSYLLLFNYGVVVFANCTDLLMTQTINFLLDYSSNPIENRLRDNYEIWIEKDSRIHWDFQRISVPYINEDILRIVMFNLAQSVALDFYDGVSETLLVEVKKLTTELENRGKVRNSKKEMLKFIGRTLNTKNKIVDNLYIFDGPEIVWENEDLDKIHKGLSRLFDLRIRFKEIEYTFKIIEDNLSVFQDLYLHKESSQLEIIIILLICIEVIDLFITKILK